MGLATLNVWIHDELDPCAINDGFWYVTVTHCNGKVLEWCGQTYRGEDAKCGHAEFALPPGCYFVSGFQMILIPNKLSPSYGSTLPSVPSSWSTVTSVRACICLLPPFGGGSGTPEGHWSILRNPESYRQTKWNDSSLRGMTSSRTSRRMPSTLHTRGWWNS